MSYKKSYFVHPSQAASTMSPAHSYTLVTHDEDDDSDICPVCDGDCTCRPTQPQLPPQPTQLSQPTTGPGPLSMAELSMRYATKTITSPTPSEPLLKSPTPPQKPSLKIKLTVPPTMLAKHRQPSSSPPKKSFSYHSYAPTSDHTTTNDLQPSSSLKTPPIIKYATKPSSSSAPKKKRGRPPKSLIAARAANPHTSPDDEKSNIIHTARSKPTNLPYAKAKVRQNLKSRAAMAKKAAAGRRRRRIESSEDDDDDDDLNHTDSSLSDLIPYTAPASHDDVQFPTFVSASGLSSLSSSNSSSSSDSSSELSELEDSDDSIEKEEEAFIVNDMKNRKRRKDDDQQSHQKRKNGGGGKNDWVIRPRRKSVGASDVDMVLDSDATEDDEDEDDEEEDDPEADADDDDEHEHPTLAAGVGVVGPASDDPFAMGMDDDEDEDTRHNYVGLATGWSEDDEDESTFDADLFFANLSDSEADSSSADGDREVTPSRVQVADEEAEADGEDEGDSDVSFGSDETAEGRVCPFEVAQGWDGQIVFTNGTNDRAPPSTPSTTVHDHHPMDVGMDLTKESDDFWAGYDSDVDMDVDDPDVDVDWDMMSRQTSLGPLDDVTAAILSRALDSIDADAIKVEGEDGVIGQQPQDGGDTTDEELITESGLPNAKAMSMFCLPWSLASVGSIDPASTVSPAVSPGRERRRGERRGGMRRKWRWARGGGGPGEVDSPRAIDILEGRVVFWDSDEMSNEEEGDEEGGMMGDEETMRRAVGSGMIGRGVFRRDRRRKRGLKKAFVGSDATASSAEEYDCEEGREVKREVRTPAPFGGPRKGVFATEGETKMVAVIGDDKKGADVPSPHPKWSFDAFGYGRGRRVTRRENGGLVESILRKHLEESLASHTPTPSLMHSPINSPMHSTTSSISLPFQLLLSGTSNNNSNTNALSLSIPSATSSSMSSLGLDDCPISATPSCDDLSATPGDTDQIELDDVLDAAFLEDDRDRDRIVAEGGGCEGESGDAQSPVTPMMTTGEGDGRCPSPDPTGAKSLSRWDVISVSAFRNTTTGGAGMRDGVEGVWTGERGVGVHHQLQHPLQHHQHHQRTPASSADFGNAIRGNVAPLLWQQKKNSHSRSGSINAGNGGGGNGARGGGGGPIVKKRGGPGPAGKVVKGNSNNGKLAKRRKLMMSAGTMSSPLVLPSSGGGGVEKDVFGSTITTTTTSSSMGMGAGMALGMGMNMNMAMPVVGEEDEDKQKSRKELRRERKLKRRGAYGTASSAHPNHLSQHHHGYGGGGVNAHGGYWHAHQHLPNARMRGGNGAQRAGSVSPAV